MAEVHISCVWYQREDFYNILKASANPKNDLPEDTQLYLKFDT